MPQPSHKFQYKDHRETACQQLTSSRTCITITSMNEVKYIVESQRIIILQTHLLLGLNQSSRSCQRQFGMVHQQLRNCHKLNELVFKYRQRTVNPGIWNRWTCHWCPLEGICPVWPSQRNLEGEHGALYQDNPSTSEPGGDTQCICNAYK